MFSDCSYCPIWKAILRSSWKCIFVEYDAAKISLQNFFQTVLLLWSLLRLCSGLQRSMMDPRLSMFRCSVEMQCNRILPRFIRKRATLLSTQTRTRGSRQPSREESWRNKRRSCAIGQSSRQGRGFEQVYGYFDWIFEYHCQRWPGDGCTQKCGQWWTYVSFKFLIEQWNVLKKFKVQERIGKVCWSASIQTFDTKIWFKVRASILWSNFLIAIPHQKSISS